MLTKLLKYEYRATARFLLPLYLGILFLIMLNVIFMRLGNSFAAFSGTSLYTAGIAILTVLCVLGFWAIFVISLVIAVQRFYGLLGMRGYLMFSLPVTADQLIASKLICSVSWFFAALLLGNVFFRMLDLPVTAGDMIIAPTFESWFSFFLLCVALLAMLCCAFLFFYFCIALGGQWPQNRLLATVVCYFVITFVLQILMMILMFAIGFFTFTFMLPDQPAISAAATGFFSNLTSGQIINLFTLFFILLFAVGDVILWLLTRHYLTKKLNLA